MSNAKSFSEIFVDPAIDTIPVGVRSGDFVHASRITGIDPVTGNIPDDLDSQLRNLFDNMRRSIEYAGGTIDNIAHVSLFMKDNKTTMPPMNELWKQTFPNTEDRPTYKFIVTSLPSNELIVAEYFAVLNGRRKSVHIDGVAHTNPIPMAVRIGDYLFSSRVLPIDAKDGSYPQTFDVQLDCLFANLAAVLKSGGLNWRDVAQGRLFIADMANLPVLKKRWAANFDGADVPPLHPIAYVVGASLVMLEIMAVKR